LFLATLWQDVEFPLQSNNMYNSTIL
jgi:hypothetical protein